jgi:hypothetical protein
MAKLLSHRTDNDIKNKWYSMKRKEKRSGVQESVNAFAYSDVADVSIADDREKTAVAHENAYDSYQQRNWGRNK